MWEQILPGLRIKIFMTVLLGVVYPLAITGICQVVFPRQANGSLVTSGGKVVGSELIGQNFTKPEYFQPRPSSAGSGYDARRQQRVESWPDQREAVYAAPPRQTTRRTRSSIMTASAFASCTTASITTSHTSPRFRWINLRTRRAISTT